ncbi:MAG: ubiquitin-like small modifier protein 1, partial [Planctomycetota bacterium]
MNVNLYATLRRVTGSRSVEVPVPGGATVRELLDAVFERYPALRRALTDDGGNLLGHVHVFVDGRDAPYLDRALETPLSGDETVD